MKSSGLVRRFLCFGARVDAATLVHSVRPDKSRETEEDFAVFTGLDGALPTLPAMMLAVETLVVLVFFSVWCHWKFLSLIRRQSQWFESIAALQCCSCHPTNL